MENIEIVLEADGKEIPMNEFVKKIMCGMITGSIQALHGVKKEWKTINVNLKR